MKSTSSRLEIHELLCSSIQSLDPIKCILLLTVTDSFCFSNNVTIDSTDVKAVHEHRHPCRSSTSNLWTIIGDQLICFVESIHGVIVVISTAWDSYHLLPITSKDSCNMSVICTSLSWFPSSLYNGFSTGMNCRYNVDYSIINPSHQHVLLIIFLTRNLIQKCCSANQQRLCTPVEANLFVFLLFQPSQRSIVLS
jgi:hypothetical protein